MRYENGSMHRGLILMWLAKIRICAGPLESQRKTLSVGDECGRLPASVVDVVRPTRNRVRILIHVGPNDCLPALHVHDFWQERMVTDRHLYRRRRGGSSRPRR